MWRLFLVVVVDFFFFFFFSADEEDYSVSEAVRSSGRCCVCMCVCLYLSNPGLIELEQNINGTYKALI